MLLLHTLPKELSELGLWVAELFGCSIGHLLTSAAIPLHEKATKNVCSMQQVHKAILSIHSWLIKRIQQMTVSLKHFIFCPFPFERSFEYVTNIS